MKKKSIKPKKCISLPDDKISKSEWISDILDSMPEREAASVLKWEVDYRGLIDEISNVSRSRAAEKNRYLLCEKLGLPYWSSPDQILEEIKSYIE